MKIDFNLLEKNPSVEKKQMTTSQETAKAQTAGQTGGYQLDISGKVMDNAAYGGQGKTMKECMQEVGQSEDVALQRNYMAVMSSSLSTEDFEQLQKEGYKPGELTVEETVTVMDRIKTTLVEAGVDIKGYTDTLDGDKLKEITGNEGRAIAITAKLKENDLPDTKENVEEFDAALKQAETLTPLSEDAMKYMVSNKIEPTIENCYLAEHSTLSEGSPQGKGYYADTGYYAKKAEDFNWDKIKGQMEKVVDEAGIAEEEGMENAKWLLENGIPLTKDTLTLYSDIKEIAFPVKAEEIMNSIVAAIQEGSAAVSASLKETENARSKAAEIMQMVQDITPEQLQKVVDNGEELTLSNLVSKEATRVSAEKAYNLISARRILEETRLQMTVEANRKLLKSDYSIETESLENVVEELKKAEKQYYGKMLGEKNPEVLSEKIEQYKDTTYKMESLRTMPAAAIGVVSQQTTFTLNQVYAQGESQKSAYEKAGKSYEALQTEVRSDLGDNIKKAFQNVDAILEDMDIPQTQDNRRAVRILGYNSMEISAEAISRVKEADQTVNTLIEKMTPATTLKLIRENINPLDMEVKDLTRVIQSQTENELSDTEKYSEFLWKLEKNNKITKEEKESYIGVYRLFNQITKSDGAAIGSLVNQNAQLTLKNLLTAVRTGKSKGIDVSVDNNFGGLEELNTKGVSILSQIETGFQNSFESSYQQSAAKEVYDKLDPQKLQKLDVTGETTLDELLTAVREEVENVEINRLYYKEAAGEIRDLGKVEDQILKSLLQFEQPLTMDNIQAASQMMKERGSLYGNIEKEAKKVSREEKLQDAIKRLQDGFTDEESAKEAYAGLKETAEEILKKAKGLENITSIDLKQLKMIHKELSLTQGLAREENYEIPVEIDGQLTTINLKILRGKEEQGKVTAAIKTAEFGDIAAEFTVTDSKTTGYIACSTKEGTDALKKAGENLQTTLKENDPEVKEVRLDIIESKSLNINQFDKESVKSEEKVEKVETRKLYQTAKSFIQMIQGIRRGAKYED